MDGERLTDDELQRYLRICRAIARRLTRHRRQLEDDAFGEACLGLAEAIAAHDPDRGPLGPRVQFLVTRRVMDAVQRERPRGHRYAKGRALGPCPPTEPLPPALADPGPPVGWMCDQHDEAEALARRVDPAAAPVFLALFTRADCATQREAAEALGISQTLVSRYYARAIGRIRERLASA